MLAALFLLSLTTPASAQDAEEGDLRSTDDAFYDLFRDNDDGCPDFSGQMEIWDDEPPACCTQMIGFLVMSTSPGNTRLVVSDAPVQIHFGGPLYDDQGDLILGADTSGSFVIEYDDVESLLYWMDCEQVEDDWYYYIPSDTPYVIELPDEEDGTDEDDEDPDELGDGEEIL